MATGIDWIGALLGKGIAEPIATYFTRKAEIKAAQHEAKLKYETAKGDRQAKLIEAGLAADATWEIEQIKNSGWKDEYVLIILSIPSILSFVKIGTFDGAALVARGFESLQGTPEWYRWLIMLVFTAVYGIRLWRRQQYDTE
jgi:hypothetical protein